MTRLVLVGLLALVGLMTSATPAGAAERPNVVLIFVDDMGYADIGPFGATAVKTPHLDAFAREGRRFTSFYATPVCSMSRACLMTGCYNVRVSIPGVLFPRSKVGLHPDEVTVAEILKSAGYATAIVGKWHLGDAPEHLPNAQGFDHYFGLPYSNDMTGDKKDYPPLPLYENGTVLETEPDQSQLTRRYTEQAVAFMTAHKDGPFFLYLPHSMIHFPLAASADFAGKSAAGPVGDAIEEVDWSVGRIMKALKELGLDEKTLVIFTSDNGPARRAAPPFRGNKGTPFEGGVREPCLMRWPGRIPAGTTCDQIAGNIDVLPTLAALCGGTLPAGRTLDGRDISSLLTEASPGPVRDVHLHFRSQGDLAAIRKGRWKLFLAGPAEGALYDLAADPSEATDVASTHPDVVADLTGEADARHREILAHRRPAGTATWPAR